MSAFVDGSPGATAGTPDDEPVVPAGDDPVPAASPRAPLIIESPRTTIPDSGLDSDPDSLAALVARVEDLDWDEVDRDLGLPPGGPS